VICFSITRFSTFVRTDPQGEITIISRRSPARAPGKLQRKEISHLREKLTTRNGTPVVDNQNVIIVGKKFIQNRR